jgi:hypothetical protein
MENEPPQTPVKFLSRSNGRIKSYGPYEQLLLPGATRPPPHRVWIPHQLNGKRASGNSSKILVTIQRSDQKFWHVRTVTLTWRDLTSSSPSIDSRSTIWKRASGSSCKILISIQRSDQKLWPLRTVTLACRDQTSSSTSIDSASTYGKGPPETLVKFRSRSNGRINSYCLYEPLLLSGATRRPPHRVSILHPLYAKGPPETQVKFWSRSNGHIKSYGPYKSLL